MPSVSKSQQRLMGVAYAVKSGSMKLKDVDAEYRDKVESLVDGMTQKSLKKYASTKHEDLPETVSEAFIGPYVFSDKMSDEELKAMYFSALDGYSYYQKGMHYAKSDYKKAYQEIEKILKKRGVSIDEDFAHAAQNITPSANIGGMGPVVFPTDGQVGSGDVPAGPQVADIDDDEEEAKKDKTKKKLEMENFGIFTQFNDFLNEAFEDSRNLVKDLHFETDPEIAQDMKIEIGKRQGEVTLRKQIEGGEYSLRRFRKEIRYGDGSYTGVFMPGSYDAATSKLGDGPHKKAVAKVKWNRKKYDQWIEDVASNDGWKHAYDMAQNAKHEPGLLQWAKKEFRGEDPMLRIQYDIEAFAESVVTEGFSNLKISGPAYDLWNDREVQRKLRGVKIRIVGDIDGVLTVRGHDDELQKVKDIDLCCIESVVNEKKLDREDMMKWIEKYMDFVKTTEEFNGSQGGIWVSGENGDEYKGREIYDYYSSDYKNRTFGVDNRWEKELNKRGWYSEWHDAGTSMIWPL